VTPPVALTIAGSDSGGGAGVQADLRTFAALGVFGTSAITAVTAQNTSEVRRVVPMTADVVAAQVHAVLDDLPVAATKTGMLASAATVACVAAIARAGRLANLVVDPVLVSSSGAALLEADAIATYCRELVPVAAVLTPNRQEAGVLLGQEIRTLADQQAAARELARLGPARVVVKGGHPVDDAGGEAVDVVSDGERVWELRAPWVETANTHGSGCTFAAAIVSGLARGCDVDDAIAAAKTFVHRAITGAVSWKLGAGHGPLDHFS
jgi:hydroxymethylpyrimidine/phosphomethylpyrimidine kinase